MTTFFCMRHGLTEWNREKRIQGQTDTELNDDGREMARKWAQSLKDNHFDCDIVSPLLRTMQTAEILNGELNLPMHVDPRLTEQDWGQWTGLTKLELSEIRKDIQKQDKKGFAFCPPGGESRDEVLMRVCDAFIEFATANPTAKVLVVTHKCVLQCLTYTLSGLDFLPEERCPIKEYRMHRIECLENELALGEINMDI